MKNDIEAINNMITEYCAVYEKVNKIKITVVYKNGWFLIPSNFGFGLCTRMRKLDFQNAILRLQKRLK